MKPPPIGEALAKGLEAFKAQMVPLIIGTLCAFVLNLVPILGWALAPAGLMNIGLKAIRGQKPEPKDAFIGFEAIVDHLVVWLLRIMGFFLCCIGLFVTLP